MLDHVTIRVADRAASERFYDTVLAAIGVARLSTGELFTEWGEFSVAQAGAEEHASERLHVAFLAPSRAHVDAFWEAGTAAGYRDDGRPGRRPQYREDYYGAFLLDPDGNSAEAVHHTIPRRATVDHLWLRVADLAAAKAFYETIAPFSGVPLVDYVPGERASFADANGSFSLVPGELPTRDVHLAFPASDHATVEAFHAAALAAGYRDNGGPGERVIYHSGYYGAFVLDPDGNNVEVVDHGR